MKYILFFSCIFISCFCCENIKMENWYSISANGLGGKKFDFLISLDKRTAVMLGGSIKDDDLINMRFYNNHAIIASTKDGGRNWSSIELGTGKIGPYFQMGNEFFIVKSIPKKQRAVSEVDSSSIYLFNASTSGLRHICTVDKFYIRNVFVKSEREILIIGKENKNQGWLIKRSNDQGASWSDIAVVAGTSFQYLNGILYFLNYDRHLLKMLTLADSKIQDIPLPSVMAGQPILNLVQDRLLLAGETSKAIHIFEYKEKEKRMVFLDELIVPENFPLSIHMYKGKLAVLTGERNTIGVLQFLCYKDGEGKWQIDEVPTSFFSPFCFIQDEFLGLHLQQLYMHKL